MVSHNHATGVTVTAITYYVEGSKGDRYAVGVDPVDGLTRCSCRAGQFGRDCRHQRAVRDGEAGKPVIRGHQRPPVKRARTSAEMRDFVSTLDV